SLLPAAGEDSGAGHGSSPTGLVPAGRSGGAMRCAVRSQSPKRKRGTFLAYASGSAFVLLLFASSLPAQFPPPVTPQAKPQAGPISALGTEGFRAILAQYGLKPLKSFDELNQDPKHTVLIAFRGSDANGNPYPDLLNNNPHLLKS